MVEFGQFLEVLLSGLLAGVLYSLVALGFVLIFKASGVFNFAQGSMVLLAGLALVRSLDFLVAQGFSFWAAVARRLGVRRGDHGDHRLAGGALRARAAGQSGRPDAVHGDHRRDLHPRRRRADAVRLRRLSAAVVSERCLVPVRENVPGRHPGQQDRRLGRDDRGGAGRGAGAVLPAHAKPGARCAPSPTITPRPNRSAFRSTGSGSSSGWSPGSWRWSPRPCGAPSSACSSPSPSSR